MRNYYDTRLSSDRLKQAYDLASPRIKQYLDAEISFVARHLKPSDLILELGCGYGRVMEKLIDKTGYIVGIDTSSESLKAAAKYLKSASNIALSQMDAVRLGFHNKAFNSVICIQNGISAFHVDPADLIRESLRVTKPNGQVLFSSYSSAFWEDRLEWFRIQANNRLIGEIDWEKSGNGKIVCKDGFSATTFSSHDFNRLLSPIGLPFEICEVDGSSLFCIIQNQ